MTWGLLVDSRLAAAFSAGGLLAYWTSSLSCVTLLELVIGRGRKKPFHWLTVHNLLRAFPAFLLTHVVYPMTMVKALRRTRVSWRGVEYEVRGRRNVRLLEYRPFQVTSDQSPSQSII